MCGIIAYQGSQPPDRDVLNRIARASSRRGPHAWGFAIVRHSSVARYVHSGPFPGEISDAALRDTAIIGHFRLATTGTYRDVTQAHPLLYQDVALVHNGVIPDAEQFAGAELATGNDSESILIRLTAGESLADILYDARSRYPEIRHAAATLDADGTVTVASVGHTVYRMDRAEGNYYGSVPIRGMVAHDESEAR